MTGIPQEVLAALGLADAGSFELVATAELPQGAVARGLASAPARPIEELLDIPMARREVDLEQLRTRGVSARRLAPEPAVVLLDAPGLSARTFGAAQVRPGGDYVLDARSREASILLQGLGEELVVVNRSGTLQLFLRRGVSAASSPEEARLSMLVQPLGDPPPLPQVDLDAVLAGEPCPAWLLAAARPLAGAPSLLARAGSVGLVGRLFTPASDLEAALARALSGGSVAQRARAWARALTPTQSAHLERLAVFESDDLLRRLDEVSDLIARDPGDPVPVLDFLLRRDDLASAAFVVASRARSPELNDAIAALDGAAATHLTALSSVELPAEERLLAVSWQEPDAWWGALLLRPQA